MSRKFLQVLELQSGKPVWSESDVLHADVSGDRLLYQYSRGDRCLDVKNLSSRWEVDVLRAQIWNSKVLGYGAGKLRCLDASTGREIWTVEGGYPVYADDRLVLVEELGATRGHDARSGTVV